jgi:hypothetical protein
LNEYLQCQDFAGISEDVLRSLATNLQLLQVCCKFYFFLVMNQRAALVFPLQ